MAQLSSPPSSEQVLSPQSWGQPKAAAALRKQASVGTASTFVPLLDWAEDRQQPESIRVGEPAAASRQGSKTRKDATLVTDGASAQSSDASISSSDDEFSTSKTARKHAKNKHGKPTDFCGIFSKLWNALDNN